MIGGGASGIFASLILKMNGADVDLFERNVRVGKKILTTGNGRCNFSNRKMVAFDYNHPEFVKSVFKQYSVDDTLAFFRSIGIESIEEENGKLFPLSLQAASIVNVFLYELEHSDIQLHTNAYITSIKRIDAGFILKDQNNQTYNVDKVIIATGGKAFPQTGSDGSGFELAKSLGHTITKVKPALVKLKLDYPFLKQIDGVKINSAISLYSDDVFIMKETGDILFTSYGISGPTVLQLSKYAIESLVISKQTELDVQLITTLSEEQLINRFYLFSHKEIGESMIGLIPSRLIQPLLKEINIDIHQTISTIAYEDIVSICNKLLHWRFKVSGNKDFDDAQVTSGGIAINEINPITLESLLVPQLFFAGEVIDIDGKSGGFNLQWAWSSGYVAAKGALK